MADAWRRRFDRVVKRYRVHAEGPWSPPERCPAAINSGWWSVRELEADPKVLIASDPTRGVDIQGVSDVHRFIREMRASGGAVLLVSHELDEVLALADRVLVLMGGRIVGHLDRADADHGSIAELMTMGAG